MKITSRPSVFKRMLALLLDFIVLGVIGYISGLFLEDFYASLGRFGTLIGTILTIVYFSVLQSKIGGGRTLGKIAINAKVTDLHGEYLTLEKSFLRSFIVFFPIMNVGIFSGGKAMGVIAFLLMLFVFVIIYFVFVNKNRRGLHDMLVSSVVTYEEVEDFEGDETTEISRRKLVPLALLGVIMVGMFTYMMFFKNELNQAFTVKEQIEQQVGIVSVDEIKTSRQTITRLGEGESTHTSYVAVTVRLDNKSEARNLESGYFEDVYAIVRNEMPESGDVDYVYITLYYGYNIGIARKSYSVTHSFRKGHQVKKEVVL